MASTPGETPWQRAEDVHFKFLALATVSFKKRSDVLVLRTIAAMRARNISPAASVKMSPSFACVPRLPDSGGQRISLTPELFGVRTKRFDPAAMRRWVST